MYRIDEMRQAKLQRRNRRGIEVFVRNTVNALLADGTQILPVALINNAP